MLASPESSCYSLPVLHCISPLSTRTWVAQRCLQNNCSLFWSTGPPNLFPLTHDTSHSSTPTIPKNAHRQQCFPTTPDNFRQLPSVPGNSRQLPTTPSNKTPQRKRCLTTPHFCSEAVWWKKRDFELVSFSYSSLKELWGKSCCCNLRSLTDLALATHKLIEFSRVWVFKEFMVFQRAHLDVQ